jgi:hypothetical protein
VCEISLMGTESLIALYQLAELVLAFIFAYRDLHS